MKMKKILYAILLSAPFLLTACNNDDVEIVATPSAQGTVVDDMGNTYEWVRIGGLDWTTSNALNGPSCADVTYEGNWGPVYLFDDSEASYMVDEYIPEYGNLMSYEAAMASAPDGWRLPTDEDWKALEQSLGMTDVDNIGWRGAGGVASRLTEKSSGARLGLQYGGGILRRQSYGQLSLQFLFFKEYGYFWTATPHPDKVEDNMVYFRKLVYGVDGVERQAGSAEYLLSVRWCRNVTND